jgi:hypothetical protein
MNWGESTMLKDLFTAWSIGSFAFLALHYFVKRIKEIIDEIKK